MAIRALELHVAQGSQAAIEALGLLGVSANRVGGENIVGTAGLRVLVIGGDHCAGLGCHGVGEALGEDVPVSYTHLAGLLCESVVETRSKPSSTA